MLPSNLCLGKKPSIGEIIEEVLGGVDSEYIVNTGMRNRGKDVDNEEEEIFPHRISYYENISDLLLYQYQD